MRPKHGDACGYAGRDCAACEGKTEAVDVLFQRRRLGVRVGLAEIPQQQRKLVAAEPPDHVGRTDLARQHGHDRLQHLIARRVAEIIVDRLEAVDVEHDQRAAGMIALDVGDGAPEFAFEAAPVGNSEQEIGIGRRLQLFDAGRAPWPTVLEPADFGLRIVLHRRTRATDAARRSSALPFAAPFARFAARDAAPLVFFFMALP